MSSADLVAMLSTLLKPRLQFFLKPFICAECYYESFFSSPITFVITELSESLPIEDFLWKQLI